MPAPTAPEPLDSNHGEDTARPDANLDGVPAFLRDRLSTAIAPGARAVIHRPAAAAEPDVASLPMLGIAPRRLVVIGLAIVLAWMLVSFGRQVAEASAASSRADDLRAANAALAVEVDALERELATISDQRYILQAARGYRLGTAQEIPFALAPDAPDLPPNAPGSASLRIGAEGEPRSPLDTWLDVLFGPDD
jgi:cell division protein FtsB